MSMASLKKSLTKDSIIEFVYLIVLLLPIICLVLSFIFLILVMVILDILDRGISFVSKHFQEKTQ